MSDLGTLVTTFLEGVLVTVIVTVLADILVPESWKEPVGSALRRAAKWIKNPKLQVSASKRISISGDVPEAAIRLNAAMELREAGLWKGAGTPLSFEFDLLQSETKFTVRIGEMYNPERAGAESREWQVTFSAETRYNDLGDTFSDLNAADLSVRSALQRTLTFVETPFSVRIGMEGKFPLAGFFRDVQPVILGGKTSDDLIHFDYAPGSLTVYAPLDSRTIKWVKVALTCL